MKEYSPIMKQYIEIKNKHKDKILFFRIGDFYEFFFNDAKEVSEILGLTLASRGFYNGEKIPMSGFPKTVANNYITKLMKLGKKIAICEQLTEQKTNGLIKRIVTKIITPGTFVPEETISNDENSYICSITLNKKIYGLSCLDMKTGTFLANQLLTDGSNGTPRIASETRSKNMSVVWIIRVK
jgi:DNA mismatch repair protein MutS